MHASQKAVSVCERTGPAGQLVQASIFLKVNVMAGRSMSKNYSYGAPQTSISTWKSQLLEHPVLAGSTGTELLALCRFLPMCYIVYN